MTIKTEIDFIEYDKNLNLTGFTLIEGFPGMGLVGTIAVKYIADKLDFKEAGYLDSDLFVPIIRIHEGKPVHPSRIYVSTQHKLVLILSEQIIPRAYAKMLARKVVEWIKKKKISRVISLAGINSNEMVKIYGIAANKKSETELEKYNVQKIKEGITTGVTALILLNLRESNVIAFSLLGNAKTPTDYKAAAATIEKLNEIIPPNFEIAPLMKEARQVEKELVKQLNAMKKGEVETKKIEDKLPMYS
ncbi:MAG: PAC2 family protein [archaeon]